MYSEKNIPTEQEILRNGKELLEQLGELLLYKMRQELKSCLNELKGSFEAPKDEKLYSRKETAAKLNISLVTLTKYVNEGRIVAHKVGSSSGFRVLFKAEDIEKCLSKKKVSFV